MSTRTLHRSGGAGGGSGFLSMSRFASMSWEEAESAVSVQPRMQPAFLPANLPARRIRASNGGQGGSWGGLGLIGGDEDAVATLLSSFGGLGGHGAHPVTRTRLRPGSRGGLLLGTSRPNNTGFDEYQAMQLLDEDVVKRGVSERRLRQLRVRPVDRKLKNRERCHVCQCEYESADQVMELPCRHVFHPDCIKGWFKENRTCPICRHEVEA